MGFLLLYGSLNFSIQDYSQQFLDFPEKNISLRDEMK